MHAPRELAGRELLWTRVRKGGDHYELRDGDEVIGRLDWERSGQATGEMAGQGWTFKRRGFFGSRIAIRVPLTERDLGDFRADAWRGGGTLELGPGHEIRMKPGNFWRTRYYWSDIPETSLVRLENRGAWTCAVEIESTAAASPDVPLLVVLGWFLLHSWSEDAAAPGG